MKCDVITAGVGGQGVLSVAGIIAAAAASAGLHTVQSEVHGMSQRGGAVIAHLRISDRPIYSGTIPRGEADVLLSMEPLEALRYLDQLAPTATILTATDPMRNITDYPELDEVLAALETLPNAVLVEATRLARQAGSSRAANVVMVGAIADLLPFPAELLLQAVRQAFAPKGEKLVKINADAFAAGRNAVHYKELVDVYDPVLV